MASTHVIVINIGHTTCAKATDVIFAKPPDVIATNAGHATPTEITHMTSTQATHVASAEAAHTATMSSTPSATAACLCTRGKKAAGKHYACQNHHHSSSHDILHQDGQTFCPDFQTLARLSEVNANVAMSWRWDCLCVVSTKFAFIRISSAPLERRECATAQLQCAVLSALKKIGRRTAASFGGARRGVRRPLDSYVLSGEKREVAALDSIRARRVICTI
jgi:hypothetical protein